MLEKVKLALTAQTTVDGKVIATHGAVIEADTGAIQFACRQIDAAACEEYRDVVRHDRTEFEDFAYDVKNDIHPMPSPDTVEPEDA